MAELLLPVGNHEMASAAVQNGADAIYVGFPGFNARGRTVDLELDELAAMIQMAHVHGVKVNIALNILIFQNEIQKVTEALEKVIALKPDAFIVQDIGLARLIREMSFEQVIHGSTQMTVTNHEAIALLDDLRIQRFVLARENSIEEIRKIKQKTDKQLEVFVHGALCVAYSGQCFTSEGIGGRSANRGQCAQSCRFTYDMYVDGKKEKMLDRQHLVSPQDLCGLGEIAELLEIGVESFKIEGRLKSPDYVAASAQEYRKAMDRALQGEKLNPSELKSAKSKMEITYSRGFSPGWLHGVRHQELVNGRFSAHRGLHIGSVVQVQKDALVIELLDSSLTLKPGHGLLIAWGHGANKIEKGAQIYGCQRQRNQWRVEFARDFQLSQAMNGAGLWLNHDPEQKKDLAKSWNDRNSRRRVPVRIELDLQEGQPLHATMICDDIQVQAQTASLVEKAKSRGVEDSFLTEELGALGGTHWMLESCEIHRQTTDPLFISHREVKELRRSLCEQLETLKGKRTVDGFVASVRPAVDVLQWAATQKVVNQAVDLRDLKMTVVLRERAQVDDLCQAIRQGELTASSLDAVILDFEFGRDYAESLQELREARVRVGIATTRILKPQEYNNLKIIERLRPDVILVRNLGSLRYFTEVSPFAGELWGDFSLNVTNHLTAQYLLSKGLHRLCVSYDLNFHQVADLLENADASKLEVTVLQYMPSFHMEHCVFAAFLSQGNSYRDCGKPCERHVVELQDQFGNRHQIKPDQECRNTMYTAAAQSALRYVRPWQERGLQHVRIEVLRERGTHLVGKIRAIQDFILGLKDADAALQILGASEHYGLGEGSLGREVEYTSRKK